MRPHYLHYSIESHQRHAHIAGVSGNAGIACPEYGVDTVIALDGRAAAALHTLVAFLVAGIIEVVAARPLQQGSAHRRHIAQLLRGTGENGLSENGITGANQLMIGSLGVPGQRSYADAAFVLFDLRQRKPVDVDQMRRAFYTHFHQVEKIGSTAQKASIGMPGEGLYRVIDCSGPSIGKRLHAILPSWTARTAATIPTYAPQRHRLPLMRSRISSSVNSGRPMSCAMSGVTVLGAPVFHSSSRATAEQICPGVQ